MKPAAILLSAGDSRRMGQPKANLPNRDGETFLGRLIRIYRAHCDPVIVVLGHDPGQAIHHAHRHQPVTFVRNPDPDRGMFSSLQTGLALVDGPVLFQPIDFPAVEESTIELLARMETPLAIPTFEGERGHPIRLGPAMVNEMKAAPAVAQARDFIRRHYPEASFLPVNDPGIVQDIDTPEDYARWLA